jgi:hypothetical protein
MDELFMQREVLFPLLGMLLALALALLWSEFHDT